MRKKMTKSSPEYGGGDGFNLKSDYGVAIMELNPTGCYQKQRNLKIKSECCDHGVESHWLLPKTKTFEKKFCRLAMLIRFRVGVDYSFHTTKRDSDGCYLLPTLLLYLNILILSTSF
ncbi:hypothetical protein L1887_05481 [Cichorium endivia]|nr:hypothetical protein L1887_05481 [Cichorium endivia]